MRFAIACLMTIGLGGCTSKPPLLDPGHSSALQDSVRAFATLVARDISARGPTAWLSHFAKDSAFYMVADGQLVFPDYAAAARFVPAFARGTPSIELHFSQVRVDPLAPGLALLGAEYHEALTDSAHHRVEQSGYLTALVNRSSAGWQFRDAHWSRPAPAITSDH
jgi:hypothetical protein